MGLLHETPAGGDGWPDYEAPAEVSGEQPPAVEPAAKPVQPAAAAREPEQPGGQPPAKQAGAKNLPPHRVEQIQNREARDRQLDDLVAENKRFRDGLAQALGITGDKPAMDPKTVRLRETMFQIMPELKDLVEKLHPKAAEIMGLADSAPQWGEQQKNYWQGVARRTEASLHDGVAKMILGDGKAAKDLEPEMLDDIRDGFVRWVERDQTGVRVGRYEAQDGSLVQEYLKAFGARYIDPVRRGAAATVMSRGAKLNTLPQSGGSGVPKAATPPLVDNKDEEAVHGRAWAVLQQLRGE